MRAHWTQCTTEEGALELWYAVSDHVPVFDFVVDRSLALKKIVWHTVKHACDSWTSVFSMFTPVNIIDTSDFRLAGTDLSWQFFVKLPENLNPSWLNMSLRTIAEALAKITASSEKSLCCNASLTMPWIAFVNIMTTFLPSFCSWASGKFSNNDVLSLVLLTLLWTPKVSSRRTYNECSSESRNINLPFSTEVSIYSSNSMKAWDSLTFSSSFSHDSCRLLDVWRL